MMSFFVSLFCDASLVSGVSGRFGKVPSAPSHRRGGPNVRLASHRLSHSLYSLSQLQEGADTGKYLSSPTPAVPPIPMAWEEEKHASRSGTPRNGVGTEATGAAWTDRRRSLGESVSSMPSEGDSVDASQGNMGDQLFYVHQLRERMSKEQIEMRSLIRLVSWCVAFLGCLFDGSSNASVIFRGLSCSPRLCDVAVQQPRRMHV